MKDGLVLHNCDLRGASDVVKTSKLTVYTTSEVIPNCRNTIKKKRILFITPMNVFGVVQYSIPDGVHQLFQEGIVINDKNNIQIW